MGLRLIAFAVLLVGVCTDAVALPDDCAREPMRRLTQEELNAAVTGHGQWLATRNDRQPQGQIADLAWADLSGLSLTGADLTDAKLAGADLTATFVDAKSIFDGADLTCAKLLNMHGPSPVTAAPSVRFFQTILVNANLTGATLPGGWFVGAHLDGAELSAADFSKADFSRATLPGARLVGTTIAGAAFADSDLSNAIWQPQGAAPDISTLGSASGLATLRLDEQQFNSGGLRLLLKGLRDGRLDVQGDDVAYALAAAETRNNSRIGNWFAATAATLFYGWGSNFGLDRIRPWLIVLAANLLFFPIYLKFGFRLGPSRLVRVSGTTTSNLAAAPTAQRWRLTTLFWLRSAIAAGVGKINLPELLGLLVPAVNLVKAVGRLQTVATVQSILSGLLFLGAAYLSLGRPLG